jgi:hypothetical protein
MTRWTWQRYARAASAILTVASGALLACGSKSARFMDTETNNGPTEARDDGGLSLGSGSPKPCENLECQRVTCDLPTTTTTLRGRVFDPSGRSPVYNAIVYVPNREPATIDAGVACETCAGLALAPVAVALTNENGEFVLKDIPVVDQLPLVVQVGKWRRKFAVPFIDRCADNWIPDKTLTLPKNQGEGDMPRIALVTGASDPMGCLLARAGVDASEFTSPTGKGRVHLFRGFGGENLADGTAPLASEALWNTKENLAKYDLVLLSCEGDTHDESKPASAKSAMREYLNVGGRVFGSHYHYTWFENGQSDLANVASWGPHGNTPNWIDNPRHEIDTSFPKGQALGRWLKNVGASADGKSIALMDVKSDVRATRGRTQRWIYRDEKDDEGPVKYMSLNTPVDAPVDQQCGRAVFTSLHISSGVANGRDSLPGSCQNSELLPQEKALLFFFFDLSSCTQDDRVDPAPPR